MKLWPCVESIFEEVADKTGKPVETQPNPRQGTMVELKIAHAKDEVHRLSYHPEYNDAAQHLAACKAVQILRFCREKEEERLIPISLQTNINNAMMHIQMETEKRPELRPVLEDEQLVLSWVLGLINQLTSQPVDLQVEKIVFERFPELRALQKQVLENQLSDFNASLHPQIEKMSPSVVFNTSAVMNSVYLKALDDAIESDFAPRISRIIKARRIEKLQSITESFSEDSPEGDRARINAWAEFLKMDSWFCWAPYENF